MKAALRALLVLLALGLSGASCMTSGTSSPQTADSRARGALTMLAAAIDPAYAVAMEGCAELEFAQVDLVKRGLQSTTKADAVLAPIRQRCDTTRGVFDSIRKAHDRAASFVERGYIADAEHEIDNARKLWGELVTRAVSPLAEKPHDELEAGTAGDDGGTP